MSVVNRQKCRRAACALLFTILNASETGLAQEGTDPEPCLPDEVDMGDYCMKLAEPVPGEDDELRRVTRFPARSLMPGRVQANTSKPPGEASASADTPAIVITDMPPAPVVAQGGFGIQFGAFSTRAAAIRAATAIRHHGTGVILSRAERGDRTLWLALAGPFASASDAQEMMNNLQARTPMDGAWVKPLKGMTLEGISNDPSPE